MQPAAPGRIISPLQRSTETTPKEFHRGASAIGPHSGETVGAATRGYRHRQRDGGFALWTRACRNTQTRPKQEERPDADYRFPGPCL